MAQTLYLPIEQVFTNLGVIGAGFKLYTYETTTSTPLATYSDTALSVANANPTIADSAGRFIQIFIGDAKLYKAVLKDADDVTVWTADPIDPKIFSLNDFDPRPTSFWGTTAGTAAAFTLVADPVISTYANTQTFFFACHLDNTAAPTIAIDGLTALNIKKYDGLGSKVALEVGDIQAGQRYEATNDGTDIIILNPEKPTRLVMGNGGELTIASGIVTSTHSVHTIDTQADASTDDLDTINGGTTDEIIIISSANSARDIVLKHGTGNIITPNGADITLYVTNDRATLQYDGSNWIVLHTKKPGEIVQIVNTQTGAVATGTTITPDDDTIPRNTEGDEYISLAITPTSASNKLKIEVVLNITSNAANNFTAALFQDSIANALAAQRLSQAPAIGRGVFFNFTHYMTAGTTSSTTFKIRVGADGANTITFNGSGGLRKYGGVMASSITITEIQA